MTKDKPREERYPCHGTASLFLAAAIDPTARTKKLQGQLLDISCNGASLALAEIITDRKHLAYAPMESDLLKLYIVLNIDDEELIMPVTTTWFNKKLSEEILPFRIGIEFVTNLTSEQLKKIRRH
ncbi:MAG: PilZ domain-containing protein [Proteobacteria bacterium]|nr:PilZ domain-containing protein [Pseudomonadota bacterium]MBU1640392.1 PilZ domain-containing protein [Pseudomonadota bacterium]